MYTEEQKKERKEYFQKLLRNSMDGHSMQEIIEQAYSMYLDFWDVVPQFLKEQEQLLIEQLVALLNCKYISKEDGIVIPVNDVIEYTLELDNMTKKTLISKLKKKQFSPKTVGLFIDKINNTVNVQWPKKKETQPTLL